MKRKIISAVCILFAVAVLFSGCNGQLPAENTKIKYKVENSNATVTELPNNTTIKTVVIPDEYEGSPVTDIADFAGCNLESVEVIKIGKNVENIGVWAFENNQSLKAFEVSEENKNFCCVDGVLYTKDMKTLLFYPAAKGESFVIPDSVKTLRTKCFYKCSGLKSLTLPSKLKTIEEKAFFRCSSLTDISIPDSLEYIGKDAFGYCSELKEITLPKGLEEIGEYAFYNCSKLLKINMKCAKESVRLGKSWYPTNNGLNIDKLEIIWE